MSRFPNPFVFISHVGRDKAAIEPIIQTLVESGISVFIDSIQKLSEGFDSYRENGLIYFIEDGPAEDLMQAIEKCAIFLITLTRANAKYYSENSDCFAEADHAREHGKRIVITTLGEISNVIGEITNIHRQWMKHEYQWIQIRPEGNFDRDLIHMRDLIREKLMSDIAASVPARITRLIEAQQSCALRLRGVPIVSINVTISGDNQEFVLVPIPATEDESSFFVSAEPLGGGMAYTASELSTLLLALPQGFRLLTSDELRWVSDPDQVVSHGGENPFGLQLPGSESLIWTLERFDAEMSTPTGSRYQLLLVKEIG